MSVLILLIQVLKFSDQCIIIVPPLSICLINQAHSESAVNEKREISHSSIWLQTCLINQVHKYRPMETQEYVTVPIKPILITET